MDYIVKNGDSPAQIARRFTGNAALMGQLVAANPHKPRSVGLNGVPTFASMAVGERLSLPPSWQRFGIGGVGLGDAASDLSAAQSYYTQGTTALAGAQSPGDVQTAITYFGNCAASALAVANDVSDSSSAAQIVNYQSTIANASAAAGQAPDLATAQPQGVTAQAAASSALALATNAASGSGGTPSGGGASLTQTAQAAVNAINADPQACAHVATTGQAVNTAVHNFKVAWNAAGKTPQLAYNGQYDQTTQAAIISLGIVAPNACASTPTPGACASGQVKDTVTGTCSSPCSDGSAPANGVCPSPPVTAPAQASNSALIAGVLIAGLGVGAVAYAVKKRHKRA